MVKKSWQIGSATVYAFVESENADGLINLVSDNLHSDYFASLNNIKESISLHPEFGLFEYVFIVIEGNLLYALVGGGAVLWLARGGKAIPLIKTLKATNSIVSGKSMPNDIFEIETSTQKESLELPSVASIQIEEQTPLKLKAANAIDKILDKIPERKIIVHTDSQGSGRAKKASLAGILLLIILAISIYVGLNRRQEQLAREKYEPVLISAIHDFEEALELADLSRARARELILSSRESALELQRKGVEDERLTKLSYDISNHLGEIAGIYDKNAEVFLDLGIISSGFRASDISLSGGLLRVLDSENKMLAGIQVSNKRTSIIAGPEYLPDAISTTSYTDRSFILSSDGIREVTGEVELLIRPDGWSPNNVIIYAFAGNIYLLDKQGDQIWRYQGVRGGFLEKEPWLGEGFTRDTSEADFMQIDGSIWTVSTQGEFSVYSLGAPSTFTISNATSPIGEVSGFYTDEQSKYIYILDKQKGRISVIEKNGNYLSEYISPELVNATDLVVDEAQRSILFLADSKLYMIKADHLEGQDENN